MNDRRSRHNLTRLEEPGHEVWILTHTRCQSNVGTHLITTADPYADPSVAIADLAEQIRARWDHAAAPAEMDMPASAPDNDFAAVALFFRKPWPVGHPWHETFDLHRATVDQRTTDDPGNPEYVLLQSYGEALCLCGNTADGYGFAPCDTRGIPDHTADHTRLVCMSCGRVLRSDTGEVIARVSDCAHCPDLVAPFAHDTFLGNGYPFIDGDQAWRHLDSDTGAGYVTCGGTTVAAPADPKARACACGGDRSDWMHRYLVQHPDDPWRSQHEVQLLGARDGCRGQTRSDAELWRLARRIYPQRYLADIDDYRLRELRAFYEQGRCAVHRESTAG